MLSSTDKISLDTINKTHVSLSDTRIVVNKRSCRSTATAIIVIVLLFSGCGSDDADEQSVVNSPTIESFSPTSGAVGTAVTIVGTNFDEAISKNILKFNGATATITSGTTTTLNATVPLGSSTGPITITVNTRSGTSSANFTVLTETMITSISHSSVHIGDTIVILGENLDKVLFNEVLFDDRQAELILTQQEDKIVAIVPVVTHEHIQLTVKGKSMALDVVGIFPIYDLPILGEQYKIQAFSDEVLLVCTYVGIFKTVDGGYSWTRISSSSWSTYNAFFLDENHGWMSVQENSNSLLYYTSDGGTSYSVKHVDESFSGIINQIVFSDVNNGYFSTATGDIYYSDNNEVSLVFDSPPGAQDINFVSLSLIDGTLIALGNQGSSPLLVKGQNSSLTRKDLLTEYITNVQVLKSDRMYMVGQYSFYTSTDQGETWMTIGDTKVYNTCYFSETKALAAIPESFQQFNQLFIYKTNDGGLTWRRYYKLRQYESPKVIAVFDKVGLIAGYDGRIWKYIDE